MASPSISALAQLGLRRNVRRALAGDEAAFTKVYRQLHPVVYAFISRRVRERADAEDLTARVFERFVTRLEQFDSSRGTVRAWVLTIARNAVIDELRKKAPEGVGSEGLDDQLADASLLPSRALEQDETAAEVRRLLADTPPRTREILALRYADGLRNKEIAELLDMSEAAVKQRISRVLRGLKQRSGELAAGEGMRHVL